MRITLNCIFNDVVNYNFDGNYELNCFEKQNLQTVLMYLYIKSLHIIFVVSWFAGLFYAPRLLIYIVEAQKKNDIEKQILTKQLLMMSSRLWHIITWPAAVLALTFGIWLITLNPSLLYAGWLHIKILFVFMLIVYHFRTYSIFLSFKNSNYKHTSHYLRLWNEVATVLLFAIVFVAVLKSTLNWIFWVLGFVILSLLLFFAVKFYKKIRSGQN